MYSGKYLSISFFYVPHKLPIRTVLVADVGKYSDQKNFNYYADI